MIFTIITYAALTVLPFWVCWKIYDYLLNRAKERIEARKFRKEILAQIEEDDPPAHILRISDYLDDSEEAKNRFHGS